MQLRIIVLYLLCIMVPSWAFAQDDLIRLLEISTENYPKLQAKKMESAAAQQSVAFEKADFIPKLTASYQANYATNNNITGMFLPGQVMPISGPPSIENTGDMVYGSAAALLLNWTPFTFGKRGSRIQEAHFQNEVTAADEQLEIFEHQVRFVHTYLDYWSAASIVRAVESDLQRYEFNYELSKVLVENGLRPGVDSAQFRSRYVKTKIALLNAKNTAEAHRAKVIELLGVDTLSVSLDGGLNRTLSVLPPSRERIHPLQHKFRQHTAFTVAGKTRLNRALLPDLMFWGTTFARGSAINFDGTFDSPTDGFNFTRFNYGVGFQISLPLFQYGQTRHQIKRQDYLISAAESYELQVDRALERERVIANSTLEKAMEAAALTPEYVQAAQFTYAALQARYDSGLINMTELLQGQFELADAESEDILAKAEMWKAILYYAAILGDLELFTQTLD